MLTAMIWRTERRTVVAAMVGGNCNMDETLEAIWAEVTTQSNALLPVLRLMALRAMTNTTVQRLEGKVQCSIFCHSHRIKIGLSKRDLKDRTLLLHLVVGRLDNGDGNLSSRCIHPRVPLLEVASKPKHCGTSDLNLKHARFDMQLYFVYYTIKPRTRL